MPATKNTGKTGIRTQSNRIPIKRCSRYCGYSVI